LRERRVTFKVRPRGGGLNTSNPARPVGQHALSALSPYRPVRAKDEQKGKLIMTTVEHILRSKGDAILSADPSVSVREALEVMSRGNVGSLLVIQDGRPVGLFAERDFARSVAARGASALEGLVGDVMVKDVLFVTLDTTIEQCMALMTEKRTRHLPVLDEDDLVGIVSIGDIVKGLIDDKDFVIEQLERYITGR